MLKKRLNQLTKQCEYSKKCNVVLALFGKPSIHKYPLLKEVIDIHTSKVVNLLEIENQDLEDICLVQVKQKQKTLLNKYILIFRRVVILETFSMKLFPHWYKVKRKVVLHTMFLIFGIQLREDF